MQASCLGLADVLPGRSWAELQPHFERLFTALLRVLDDVKESVRKAALAGWRAVCNAASRLSDPASGSVSAEQALSVLGLVLPLLLESHTHNSAEVRSLAAKQMLKLCESGGKHLSPHAVRLVPALLENLSVLEDQALNYLQQHAEAAGVSEQAMESARIAATRGSDSSGALEQLLKVMGQEQVAAVAPQLAHLLSHGVGLPTRVGTARFVLQLAQSHGAQFKGVAPRMLTTLRAAILTERSATARRAYASAAAIVSRLCSAEQLAELVRGLASRYAGEGSPHATDEDARMTVALFVRELLRGAPDAMAAPTPTPTPSLTPTPTPAPTRTPTRRARRDGRSTRRVATARLPGPARASLAVGAADEEGRPRRAGQAGGRLARGLRRGGHL